MINKEAIQSKKKKLEISKPWFILFYFLAVFFGLKFPSLLAPLISYKFIKK